MNYTKLLQSAALPLAALCLAPLTCLAQGNSPQLFDVTTLVIKPGMTAKFEQGAKDALAYLQSHGATNRTAAFEVRTGPQAGTIVILSPFHWDQFDHPPAYEAGFGQLIDNKVAPYLSSLQGAHIIETVPELSGPAQPNAAPEKWYAVVTIEIRPGKMNDFLAAAQVLGAAHTKAGDPSPSPNSFLVYRNVSGDSNEVILAVGRPSAADFGRPRGKSNLQVLQQVFGSAGTSIERAVTDSIESENIAFDEYRPDLSFIPSGQGQ